MAERTRSKIIIGLLSGILLLSAISASSTIYDWESITSQNFVKEMVRYNSEIWVGTTGGLVRIDPSTAEFDVYTNVDGLGTNQVEALCVDDKNRLWVGTRGFLVNFSDPAHPDGYIFTDRDGALIDIFDIACSPGGDTLWVANTLGISLFLAADNAGEGLILDTYTRLGGIDREMPVTALTLGANTIWAATRQGLAVGYRDDPRLLKSPTGWFNYDKTNLPGLPGDTINGVIMAADTLFIGTSNGVYRVESDSTAVSLGIYGDPLVYNMSAIGDSMLVNDARGSVLYFNGNLTYYPTTGMPIENSSAGVFDDNGMFWNGNLVYGIYYLQNNTMMPFEVGSMPVNGCLELKAIGGKIWGAFDANGLAYYENGVWTTVDTIKGNVNCMAEGPLGELWVGTWGNGAWRILGDSIAHFNETNSALSGLASAPTFVVVNDIISTGDGVWFGQVGAQIGDLVAVNPNNIGQWHAYRLASANPGKWVNTLATGQGVIYTGTLNSGIYARLYNGTPLTGSDDYVWQFDAGNSGIGSDGIMRLGIDSYDTLWVGTSFGLSYQSLGEIYFFNVSLPEGFGPAVNALAFDGQGNLYAGSNEGLVIRDIATGEFEQFTETNSGLVSNSINDIIYDKTSNTFWIATNEGISKLRAPYKLAEPDIGNVSAYPNPFVIRYGTEVVRFNYNGTSEVRIFTLAGELVRELPVTGQWDGMNAAGEPVASGVYLFTLTSPDGEVGRGKIFLVRE